MIGGDDICIPTRAGLNALDLCIRIICAEWPSAIFEDADSGTIWQDYESLPLGKVSEFFVYRDKDSAEKWEALGADPSLANTMIHLLPSDSIITLVVDDPNSEEMKSIIELIRTSLKQDILNIPARREKAA